MNIKKKFCNHNTSKKTNFKYLKTKYPISLFYRVITDTSKAQKLSKLEETKKQEEFDNRIAER